MLFVIHKAVKLILERLEQIMAAIDDLTAQVTKNNADIDAVLAALQSSATPAQLEALTSALETKDALIEQALNTPAPAAS